MNTSRRSLNLSVAVALAALTLVGCGKKEEETPPAPPPAKIETTKPQPKTATTTSKPAATAQGSSTTAAVPHLPPPPTLTKPSETPQTAGALEAAYRANPDFAKRVEVISNITDLETPEMLPTLGRLFQVEKDPDLKTEILDSLFDIDGQDEMKAALLAAGASADQPKEVRESAIDALGDIDPKYALPILRALASDPDEDIRDQAKDTIEQLQAEHGLQK